MLSRRFTKAGFSPPFDCIKGVIVVELFNQQEVEKRRTFAIISHPDAGKTTLTGHLLLLGGAIHEAGRVKARAAVYLEKQMKFDRDLWIVEIEDRESRAFVDEKIV